MARPRRSRALWWSKSVTLYCRRCTHLVNGHEADVHIELLHGVANGKRARSIWPFVPKAVATSGNITRDRRRAEALGLKFVVDEAA